MPPKSKAIKNIVQGQVYGYLRVSTEKQFLENNRSIIQKKKDDLGLIGNIEWTLETISGCIHWKFRELNELVEKFKPGDILIISEISRIGRKFLEIQEFVSVITQKQVRLYSLDIPGDVDLTSVQGSMILCILSIGAQIEREAISNRTRNALAERKSRGIILGRPKGSKNKNQSKLESHKEIIKKRILDGVTLKHLSADYGCSQQTMCAFVKNNNLKPSQDIAYILTDNKDSIEKTT